MRPDVKLGIVISAVVVLVTGGYFMLRNKGDQPVPLSGQPAATAPATGKDQKDAAGKSTAKNPAAKPSGTQTDGRGARTRPGVDGSNASGRTAATNPSRVTDAANQPGRAANPGGATRNPQVASQNPTGAPSSSVPSGTRTATLPSNTATPPSSTPDQTSGERVASRDMSPGTLPGPVTGGPVDSLGRNLSASNPVHSASPTSTPGSATALDSHQPGRSESAPGGPSTTPRLASSPVDGGASPVPATGRPAGGDSIAPGAGIGTPPSNSPTATTPATTGGSALAPSGPTTRDARPGSPSGTADSRVASGRDAASANRTMTNRESATPNRGAPVTTPSEVARDARAFTPSTTPGGTRTDGAGGSVETHRVQSGDTFASLARKYYGSERYTDFLVKSNAQIATPDRLAIGMTVRIPPAPTDEQLAQATSGMSRPGAEKKADGANGVPASKPGDARTSESKASDAKAPSGTPGDTNALAGKTTDGKSADGKGVAAASGRSYRVKEGDTFYSIAKSALGSSSRWKELFELNKQAVQGDPTRLRAGQTLTLPRS